MEAIWRCHEAGMTSQEIAKAAAAGETELPPFEVKARTVRNYVRRMSKEPDRHPPATPLDLELSGAMETVPARAARVVEREMRQIEAKSEKGKPLTDRELARIPTLAKQSERLAKQLQSRKEAKGRQSNGRKRRGQEKEESVLERDAREWAEQQGQGGERGAEVQLSRTHACQTAVDPPSPGAPAPAPATPADEHSEPPDTAADRNGEPTPPPLLAEPAAAVADGNGAKRVPTREERRRQAVDHIHAHLAEHGLLTEEVIAASRKAEAEERQREAQEARRAEAREAPPQLDA